MRPTRRGLTALAIVALALAASVHAGPRALNAVVAPLVVVTVAGVAVVAVLSEPTVERAPVEAGFPGDRRTVSIGLESDASAGATIRDRVGAGLRAVDDSEPAFETTLEAGRRFSYELELGDRGVHRVGPASLVVTDVFGLVSRRFDLAETTTVIVYPQVRSLDSRVRRDLRGIVERAGQRGGGRDLGREEFDHIREYRRGDQWSDVNWKASARRPTGELLVTERRAADSVGAITVALEGSGDDLGGEAIDADELASVGAAVLEECLEAGLQVGLVAGEVHRPPGIGADHYRDLLAVLARWDGNELESTTAETADVVVSTTESGTIVSADGLEVWLELEGDLGDGSESGARADASGPRGGRDDGRRHETDGDGRSEVDP